MGTMLAEYTNEQRAVGHVATLTLILDGTQNDLVAWVNQQHNVAILHPSPTIAPSAAGPPTFYLTVEIGPFGQRAQLFDRLDALMNAINGRLGTNIAAQWRETDPVGEAVVDMQRYAGWIDLIV